MADTDWTRRAVLTTAAASLATTAHASAPPIARTRHGRVRGAEVGGVLVFRGVRYGADTAPRRFQAPLPPAPWSGVRDALVFGDASPQTSDEPSQSEDCLFLNVWTPALDRGRRAVMVYIHGGAYSSGSGSGPLLDGGRICQRGDVVVVTLNHRLGPLGYAYLASYGDTFADSGNVGQLDLVLALEWVRDNIAEFGGDPVKVMVFGQSGGGAKIATLMAMPAARGLFHRAATMSGQQVTASGPNHADTRAATFVRELGLTANNIADIRNLPLERLLHAAHASDPILGSGSLYFGPVLDDKNLTRHPFYPDAAPQSLQIPLMLGNTHDETRGFSPSPVELRNLTWESLGARLAVAMRVDVRADTVIQEYRRLYPQITPLDVYFAATTASRSWRGQIIEAEERARAGAPAYVYQLDWRAPAEGGIYGAPHTLDIPLVFGNLEASRFIGARTPEAEAVSQVMMDAFIAFAKTGDPNGGGLPRWSPYTLGARETMIFDNTSRMENDPRKAERELFARVPYIQPGT
ncbi:MAG: carboxylesterase/lipase family protein [Pseudomonadota bacterium]